MGYGEVDERFVRDNTTHIKVAQQVLASHKEKLASAADKDSVRRSIEATKQRIRDLKVGHDEWRDRQQRLADSKPALTHKQAQAEVAGMTKRWQKEQER